MRLEKILPKESRRRKLIKKAYYKFLSQYSEEERTYYKWILQNEPNNKELEKQKNEKFKLEPKISIVVPVYKTPEKFMRELIESLQRQTYSNWELCLADGSDEPISYIKKYTKSDERIKYRQIGENKGISGNTNEALRMATGEYIGLVDHDDLLPDFSLYEVVKAINNNKDAMFIYSDEDKLEEKKGPRYGVFFKPDFSPYTLNSANYINHFTIIKKELFDKIGGFRSEYDGSQDFDLFTRAIELIENKNIVHIPKVLYHWRAHRNSTAANSDSKPYAFEVGKNVIKDRIKRTLNTDVEVLDSLTPGSYELHYKVKGEPKVSIILDATEVNLNEVNNILNEIKTTNYGNYEIIAIVSKEISKQLENEATINRLIIGSENAAENYNNAVASSGGEYFIIFDTGLQKIDKKNYIEDLVGICQDDNVGIVGTKLYNKNGLVEHSGIVLGMNGLGDYLYKGAPKDIGTYMQRLAIIHNVSVVYAKYALIKKSTFEKVYKFAEGYTGMMLNIDICLKMLEMGKQVVLNPVISFEIDKIKNEKLEEAEKHDFMKKWDKFYNIGDIYFSPNLSKNDTGLRFNV